MTIRVRRAVKPCGVFTKMATLPRAVSARLLPAQDGNSCCESTARSRGRAVTTASASPDTTPTPCVRITCATDGSTDRELTPLLPLATRTGGGDRRQELATRQWRDVATRWRW